MYAYPNKNFLYHQVQYSLLAILFSLGFTNCFCQKKTTHNKSYKPYIFAFYNCENLFDTVNNVLVDDDTFCPNGERHYNTEKYSQKIENIASVLAGIGQSLDSTGADLIGLAEVENDNVLKDLVLHPLLRKRGYRFVHYDSKDARGFDCALLYKPGVFKVVQSKPIFVALPHRPMQNRFTRDILLVNGVLDGEPIDVLVNHWPGKLAGDEEEEPGRLAAASTCRIWVDDILQRDSSSKIVVMGDFNDAPDSRSVQKVLKSKGDVKKLGGQDLYNPYLQLSERGLGTLAFGDTWGLFDQLLLSNKWLDKSVGGIFFYKAFIFNEPFLVENIGVYKGYPMKSWDGVDFHGGYSDHFPVYALFLRGLK